MQKRSKKTKQFEGPTLAESVYISTQSPTNVPPNGFCWFVGLEWQLAAKARVVPFPHQCCARPTFAQDIAGCSAIPFMSNQCITFQCISILEDLKQGESSLYNSPKWKIGVHLDSFKKPLVLDQKVGSSQI